MIILYKDRILDVEVNEDNVAQYGIDCQTSKQLTSAELIDLTINVDIVSLSNNRSI